MFNYFYDKRLKQSYKKGLENPELTHLVEFFNVFNYSKHPSYDIQWGLSHYIVSRYVNIHDFILDLEHLKLSLRNQEGIKRSKRLDQPVSVLIDNFLLTQNQHIYPRDEVYETIKRLVNECLSSFLALKEDKKGYYQRFIKVYTIECLKIIGSLYDFT